MTDQTGHQPPPRRAVPLTEAARLLATTPDTLRKRLLRGSGHPAGYKLDGRWYVYLPDGTETGPDHGRDSPATDGTTLPVAAGRADPALLAVLGEIAGELRALRGLMERLPPPPGPDGTAQDAHAGAVAAPETRDGTDGAVVPRRWYWWLWPF